MKMMDNNLSNVRLPDHLWDKAQDKEHLKQLILEYLKLCYPGYEVKKVKGRFAVCEIHRN